MPTSAEEATSVWTTYPAEIAVKTRLHTSTEWCMDRLSGAQHAIERRPWRAFAVLSLIYAVTVFGLSWLKLLWLDELITLHIARLPTVGDIYRALQQGADPNPPLTHILVHFSRKLFGETESALRLPAMIGFWIGILSIFTYLKRRVGSAWAFVGTLTSMSTAAFEYSYESRSYAIYYGLAMLAFLCWAEASAALRARATTLRVLSLAGLVLALAASVCTNYFSVVSFLPIAIGQIVADCKSAQRPMRSGMLSRRSSNAVVSWLQALGRESDWGVWAALCLAALPLVGFSRLIEHSIAQFAPHAWNHVSWDPVVDAYFPMMDKTEWPVLAMLLLCVASIWLGRNCASSLATMKPRWLAALAREQQRLSGPVLPLHEMVGAFALLLYPVLGFYVASVHGGMLSPRFIMPVIYGFGITAAVCGHRLFGARRGAAVLLLGVATCWFFTRNAIAGANYSNQKDAFWRMVGHLPEVAGTGNDPRPIAIPDPLLALTFMHYAPKALTNRVVFPVDFPAIRMYRGQDSPEENLWPVRNTLYRELRVVLLADFERTTPRYVIVAGFGNWMVEALLHHRYPVTLSPVDPEARNIFAFTDVSYGFPNFFSSDGDPIFERSPGFYNPVAFQAGANLPAATLDDPLLY